MKILVLAALIAAFVSQPDAPIHQARNALKIWGYDVIPSLFPYMVLCKMLALQLHKRGLSSMPATILLGFAGGSPSGAALLSSSGVNLSRRTLLTLSALTGTISPMFFIGTLNAWIDHQPLCVTLFVIHVLSTILTALLVWIFVADDNKCTTPVDVSSSEINPVAESIQAIAQVGGCIVFFSAVSAMICQIPLDVRLANLIHSAMEVAGGLHSLTEMPVPKNTLALWLAAATGFTGLSIQTQNHSFLAPLGVCRKQILLNSFMRCTISFLMMHLVCTFVWES